MFNHYMFNHCLFDRCRLWSLSIAITLLLGSAAVAQSEGTPGADPGGDPSREAGGEPAGEPGWGTPCGHNELRRVDSEIQVIGSQGCGGITFSTPGISVTRSFDKCPGSVIYVPAHHEVIAVPKSGKHATQVGKLFGSRQFFHCKTEHIIWFIPVSSTCVSAGEENFNSYPLFRLDTCPSPAEGPAGE